MSQLAISPSDRVFVLTGAGVSAESGIPTFRDAGGLWRNYRFEEVASPHAWRRDPRLVWDFYSMSRRDSCARPPFEDAQLYESPTELPLCTCGGRIRPHICWFGESPFHLERIFAALDESTLFLAIGTSGSVEPAASFAAHARRHAKTFYVGPELPANQFLFEQCFLAKAGELLPVLLVER